MRDQCVPAVSLGRRHGSTDQQAARVTLTPSAAPSMLSRYMRLSNKVAIITGGAAGIGFAYARRFVAEGARVVVADVADPVAAAGKLDAGERALGVVTDVSDARSVHAMVDAAVARFGRIDILVNNAALFAPLIPKPFDQIPEAEWDRVMAVNVKGVWNCTRAVAPVMRAQGSGRVINVASAIVAKGTAMLMHYVTSKGAVVAMTRALARELGPAGIAVNAVAPGLILSDTVQANPDITAFQHTAIMQARSLKREAFPEDVEGTVVFLASDDSAFMSGQTLIVDGGSVFSTLCWTRFPSSTSRPLDRAAPPSARTSPPPSTPPVARSDSSPSRATACRIGSSTTCDGPRTNSSRCRSPTSSR